MAARFNRSVVIDASPTMRGSRSLRAPARRPRDCLTSVDASVAPRLKSSPRSIASRNDRVPEKGRRLVLGVEPRNDPCTSMTGLSVLTPVVRPGTAVWVATTVPDDRLRPESGTKAGGGADAGGADTWATDVRARPRVRIRMAHRCCALVTGEIDMRFS